MTRLAGAMGAISPGSGRLAAQPLSRSERLGLDAVLDQQLAQLAPLGAGQTRSGADVAARAPHRLRKIVVLELADGAGLGRAEADLRLVGATPGYRLRVAERGFHRGQITEADGGGLGGHVGTHGDVVQFAHVARPGIPVQDQTDDHKSGGVVAQRAGDIVTRRNQIHVYQPLLANARDGYWPAGALMETDASTGKWQELTPTLSNSCAVFPHSNTRVQAQQGDYAWALWRPYACCRRRGQVFLGSIDFM